MLSQSFLVKSLAVILAGAVLAASECDNIFYIKSNQLCYGELSDTSTDMCTDIPLISYANAMAINPVTDEFYIISVLNGTEPEEFSAIQTDRYLMRFTATVEGGAPVVDEPEIIGSPVLAADSTEKIGALAFTCQGVPRLFGLTELFSGVTEQFLYEIDYQDSGNLTQLDSFTGVNSAHGWSLFYNVETELLYKVNGFNPTKQNTIDPFDSFTVVEDVLSYSWPNSYSQFSNNLGSYFNETHFITRGRADFIFLASLEDASFADFNITDRRGEDFASDEVLTDVECADFSAKCLDSFSEEPSVQPSFQPTLVPSAPTTEPSMIPSTDPSSMPSSDPSSMPTEMPVEAMMTTEDEVMADTTMEPESPEQTDDSPEPTVADSASKNSISFIMVFTVVFGYLFY